MPWTSGFRILRTREMVLKRVSSARRADVTSVSAAPRERSIFADLLAADIKKTK